MKIGILELRSDPFVQDVATLLRDLPVEFMSWSAAAAPLAGDYRVVVDRLSFCSVYLREVVKSLALDGAYVVNNPFATSATSKLIDMKLCVRLGIAVPRTVALPQTDGCAELEGAVTDINWEKALEGVGFPCILKPFDGYAWEDVFTANSLEEVRAIYARLKSRPVLLAQQLIKYREYYRVFCIDKKDVLFIKWIPRPAAMGEYLISDLKPIEGIKDRLAELTIQLNTALDLDINVVEWCLDEEGRPWVIDAFNEVPDVRPTSLPADYYRWIVEKFAACIRDKALSGERNRTVFE